MTEQPWTPDWRVHPGETLRECLQEREMTQAQLASAVGMTQKHISFVVNGRASITAPLAVRLERELAIGAEFWMALQTNHDLHEAREKLAAEG